MSIQAKFKIKQGGFNANFVLNIPVHGITALFGPSGAGKTTLLRALAGLDRHPDGYLQIGDVVWQDKQNFVPTHKRQLGYVFQEASLFAHLNVRQNLAFGARRNKLTESTNSSQYAIELLGVEDLLDRRVHTLSGGERQRVAIARALSSNPKLLLMDEPLASLDQARKQEILPYLESLHRTLEIPVIYVSHSADEVAQLADHLVLLEAGSVSASGAIAEILTRLDLALAHSDNAEAIIEASVAAHDDKYALTQLEFIVGRFTVTRQSLAIGSKLRLRIAARDVSITLQPQKDTSILNIFPATVGQVIDTGDAQVVVKLMLADTPILARISRKSADILDLSPGKAVYAQVKSAAVLV